MVYGFTIRGKIAVIIRINPNSAFINLNLTQWLSLFFSSRHSTFDSYSNRSACQVDNG
jgi:hypothetical protein